MCEKSKLPCGKIGGEWKDLFMSQQTNWFYQQMIPYAIQSLGLKKSHEVLMGGRLTVSLSFDCLRFEEHEVLMVG